MQTAHANPPELNAECKPLMESAVTALQTENPQRKDLVWRERERERKKDKIMIIPAILSEFNKILLSILELF